MGGLRHCDLGKVGLWLWEEGRGDVWLWVGDIVGGREVDLGLGVRKENSEPLLHLGSTVHSLPGSGPWPGRRRLADSMWRHRLWERGWTRRNEVSV